MIEDIIKTIDNFAETDPNRVCYDYLGELHTYKELKDRSDDWAKTILQKKISPTQPIMVWGGQSFDVVASFLGCVKSGHAYIPISDHSNLSRLTMIQEISNSPALILHSQLAADNLPDNIEIIRPFDVIHKDKELDCSLFVHENDDFYIIFTSGTTGKPKGVQISHSNLLSFTNWLNKDFNLPKNPSFLEQAPYSFDLSVMSLYPALTTGGKLVVLPYEVTQDFAKLYATLPKLQFNVWVSTPSFVQMCFLDKTFDQKHHSDLSHFLFCGEELPHSEAVALKNKFPLAHIFNTYGPTETTVAVTKIEITDEILKKYDRLPIGFAKKDTNISIDNSDVKSDNKKGEIIISGPSVSKGYLNNPQKTKKAFTTNIQGHRSYHTGDSGYFADRMLFYQGRLDFQVKFNGYRIELEEINHYLDSIPFVKYGVVAPKYDKNHAVKQLVAVIELDNAESINLTESELTQKIRTLLKPNVMSYMLPQRYLYKDKLPISQNGKVDIKAVISEVNS